VEFGEFVMGALRSKKRKKQSNKFGGHLGARARE
jgi:hypothetical protein